MGEREIMTVNEPGLILGTPKMQQRYMLAHCPQGYFYPAKCAKEALKYYKH